MSTSETLPAGVARYPLPSQKTTVSFTPWPVVIGLSTIAVVTGAVLPLYLGEDPGLVAPVAGGAFVVGFVVAFLLPEAFKIPFIIIFLLFSSTAAGREHVFVVPALVMFSAAGYILAGNPRRALIRRRRADAAEGAPPARRDPGSQIDVGVLALWDDHVNHFEKVDYDGDFAVSLVRQLDGDARIGVTFFHGRKQLDVGGDAAGVMVVLGCLDRKGSKWRALVDPKAAAKGPEAYTPAGRWVKGKTTDVKVLHMTMKVHPGHAIRDLDVVESVVRRFALTGELDSSRTWFEGTWNHPVERPWTLTSTTDYCGSTFAPDRV